MRHFKTPTPSCSRGDFVCSQPARHFEGIAQNPEDELADIARLGSGLPIGGQEVAEVPEPNLGRRL
jgi:hypothetical protein